MKTHIVILFFVIIIILNLYFYLKHSAPLLVWCSICLELFLLVPGSFTFFFYLRDEMLIVDPLNLPLFFHNFLNFFITFPHPIFILYYPYLPPHLSRAPLGNPLKPLQPPRNPSKPIKTQETPYPHKTREPPRPYKILNYPTLPHPYPLPFLIENLFQ